MSGKVVLKRILRCRWYRAMTIFDIRRPRTADNGDPPTDRPTDRPTDPPNDPRTSPPTDWPTDRLTNSPTHRLDDPPTHLLTHRRTKKFEWKVHNYISKMKIINNIDLGIQAWSETMTHFCNFSSEIWMMLYRAEKSCCVEPQEDCLLSWHGSHFWVCITHCRMSGSIIGLTL